MDGEGRVCVCLSVSVGDDVRLQCVRSWGCNPLYAVWRVHCLAVVELALPPFIRAPPTVAASFWLLPVRDHVAARSQGVPPAAIGLCHILLFLTEALCAFLPSASPGESDARPVCPSVLPCRGCSLVACGVPWLALCNRKHPISWGGVLQDCRSDQ